MVAKESLSMFISSTPSALINCNVTARWASLQYGLFVHRYVSRCVGKYEKVWVGKLFYECICSRWISYLQIKLLSKACTTLIGWVGQYHRSTQAAWNFYGCRRLTSSIYRHSCCLIFSVDSLTSLTLYITLVINWLCAYGTWNMEHGTYHLSLS